MVSFARATRGVRRPSLDTRSGRPIYSALKGETEERWSFNGRS